MRDWIPTELKHAVRSLLRSPGLAAAAILALAIGIGATATMYSILRATTRNLPFEDADDIVGIKLDDPVSGLQDMVFELEDFVELDARQSTLQVLAAFEPRVVALSGATDVGASEYQAARVTPDFFGVVRVEPALGRSFTPDDALPGATPVALISDRLWEQAFERDPEVVGRVVRLDRTPTEIVGVMPQGFHFPIRQDVWLPLVTRPVTAPERGQGPRILPFGRLSNGADPERAAEELTTLIRRRSREIPEYAGYAVAVDRYPVSWLGPEIVRLIFMMVVVVSFVLAIAAVNVANLLLARAVSRNREVSVRMALGSGRLRVVAGFLTEALLIGALGACAGTATAWLGVRWFSRAVASEVQEYWLAIRVDARVLGLVVLATVGAALLAGMLPAIQASSQRLGEALRVDARGTTRFRMGAATRALVVGQLTLATALLVLAGIIVKGAVEATDTRVDFATDGIVSASFSLTPPAYRFLELVPFVEALESRLERIPGVTDVTFANDLPGVPYGRRRFGIDGRTDQSEAGSLAQFKVVWPSFMDFLGLSALEGRTFTGTDVGGAETVAVVTDVFAERFFPEESPLGRTLRWTFLGAPTSVRIVGVVPDAGVMVWNGETVPGVYVSMRQYPQGTPFALLRAPREEGAAVSGLRGALAAMDPDLALGTSQTLDESIRLSTTLERTLGGLFLIVGLAGLALATVGLYGVVSFGVASRSGELAIRRAIGAGSSHVAWVAARASLAQLTVGLMAGTGIALVVARTLGELRMGQSPTEPLVYGGVTLILVLATLAATAIPLRRALRVDPMDALRAE